ncbi:MAG: site-2 protease family protein, partial [Acidobacteria bacterium]|nr:site-2 protease family protein [Acidobacteriota bacterium]
YHYAGFNADFSAEFPAVSFLQGAWFSLTLLGILAAHEFGHYFACRYYGVDATLPYFLPAPLPLTGTVGALIRIRQPIQSKPVLFDVGAAGPIAGFVVAVPALFLGLQLSRVVAL